MEATSNYSTDEPIELADNLMWLARVALEVMYQGSRGNSMSPPPTQGGNAGRFSEFVLTGRKDEQNATC